MSDLPVFQTASELRLWKGIRGEGLQRFFGDSKGGPEAIRDSVLSSEGSVHPAILIALMEELPKTQSGLPDETLKALAAKARSADAMPSVKAAYIALEREDTALAAELLAGSSGSMETANRYLALSEVYLKEGDVSDARESAEKVLGADPDCERAYEILESLDPSGGWAQRNNIRKVMSGGKPDREAGSGRMQELYSIYYDWFSGRREAATGRMVESRFYKEKDAEYMLASARFSVDEKDWHSAKMVYDGLVERAPQFVRCEAAETYLKSGDPGRALKLFEQSDRRIPRVMQGIIRSYAQLGDRADMMDSIRAYLDSEFVGLDEYLGFVRMLMDMDLYGEAESLMVRITEIYPKESSVLTIQSMVRLHNGDIPSAMSAAKAAVRHDKDDLSAAIQRARMYLVIGKDETAEKECNRVLSIEPGYREALDLLNDVAAERKDDRSVLEITGRILESDPSDVKALRSKACALCSMGDCEGAQEILARCLTIDPTKDGSLETVGIMMEHGMFREAVYACNELVRTYEDDAAVRRMKGNAEYGVGDYLKASVSFASAAEIDPENPDVWHSKGMADEARGDMQSAEEAYDRALMIDLTEPRYWMSKAAMQNGRGDYVGAIASLDRVMYLDPKNVTAMVRKAGILSSKSRYNEAIRYMEMAMAADPDDRSVAKDTMRIMMSAGRLEEASAIGTRLTEDSTDTTAAALMEECRSRIEQSKPKPEPEEPAKEEVPEKPVQPEPEPAEVSESATEPEPVREPEPERKEDPASLAAMAASLLAAGDRKGAIRMIDSALEEEPDNPDFIIIKSRAVLASGDRDAATVMISAALNGNPNCPQLHEMLGDLRVLAGDNRGAVIEYESAVAQGLDGSDLHVKMGDAFDHAGDQESAVRCYTVVMERGDGTQDMSQKLVRLLIAGDSLDDAEKYIHQMLETDSRDAAAWVLAAELAKVRKDDESVLDAYIGFRRCPSPGADSTVRMVKLLEETGHPDKASEVMGEKTPEAQVDKAVKRYAEKAMRKSFTSKIPLDDPDLLMSLGLEPDVADQVSAYLSQVPEYGKIVQGTDEFREMERKSNSVIMKMKWTDLENQPRLPLEKAFVAGSFRDADDAKALVAYVYKVMHYDVGRKAEPRLADMSMRLPRGMTVYEVMKECDIGVYEAKQVLAQIV